MPKVICSTQSFILIDVAKGSWDTKTLSFWTAEACDCFQSIYNVTSECQHFSHDALCNICERRLSHVIFLSNELQQPLSGDCLLGKSIYLLLGLLGMGFVFKQLLLMGIKSVLANQKTLHYDMLNAMPSINHRFLYQMIPHYAHVQHISKMNFRWKKKTKKKKKEWINNKYLIEVWVVRIKLTSLTGIESSNLAIIF